MTRRRYLQQPDGSLVEIPPDYVQEPLGDAGHVFTDAWLEGTRSPIDGSLIDTRAKMREHMKVHKVAHFDEIKPDIDRTKEQNSKNLQRDRIQDLNQAYEKVRDGYRPKIQHYE